MLLQVFLHSAIAEQDGRFSIADVAAGISEKMVRRHPHVFGSTTVSGADQVAANWEAIKAAEKGVGGGVRTSSVDGVQGDLPALAYARELSARAAKVGLRLGRARGDARQGGGGAGRGARGVRRSGRRRRRDRRPAVRHRQPGPPPRRGPGGRAAPGRGQVPPAHPGLRSPRRRAGHRHPHRRPARRSTPSGTRSRPPNPAADPARPDAWVGSGSAAAGLGRRSGSVAAGLRFHVHVRGSDRPRH